MGCVFLNKECLSGEDCVRVRANGHRTVESGHRKPISGHRTLISGHRTPMSGHRSPITGHRTSIHIKINKIIINHPHKEHQNQALKLQTTNKKASCKKDVFSIETFLL